MDIVLRATGMFVVVFVLLRLMGKREIAQMTPFELVLLVVMGDLIQQGVTHNDFSVTGAMLAISTFAFWALVMNWMTYRWRLAERILDGEPAILIRSGKMMERNLRRNRMSKHDLLAEMRLAGIGSIEKVEWALLETNGKISFISRQESQGGGGDKDDRAGD